MVEGGIMGGCYVHGIEGSRQRVATNEAKTNYVQAVNYQTLEQRVGTGRGKEEQQRVNNWNPVMRESKDPPSTLLPALTHIPLWLLLAPRYYKLGI